MTIILPKDYHAKQALEQNRIICVPPDEALKEDIRALRIGILNIMPKAESYEFSLLHPLGRSIMQIEPIWIKLKTHQYKSSDQEHIQNLYVTFEDALKHGGLDGLVLTGAPVEEIPFEDVLYWEEIKRILKYARHNIPSTLGICWGGLALAKFMDIDKVNFTRKLFGVYKTHNLDRDHTISGGLDDIFWCPQSRFSGISDTILEEEQRKGNVHLLAHAQETGYTIFESSDNRFLMHLGHPEYEPSRLVEEYTRDMARGLKTVDEPANLDLGNPINCWRGHRNEFFSQWIRFIHETTAY